MKNADVQFTGPAISDPFTGVCVCVCLSLCLSYITIFSGGGRYIPGQGNNDSIPQLGSGGPIHDPFTGNVF